MLFLIHCPPYSHDIAFALDETDEAIFRYLRQALHVQPSLIISLREKFEHSQSSTRTGVTYHFDDGTQLIRMPRKVVGPPSMAVLVHEIIHAASFILRRAGIEHTDETEEAYTYLIEEVTRQAFTRVGKQWWT